MNVRHVLLCLLCLAPSLAVSFPGMASAQNASPATGSPASPPPLLGDPGAAPLDLKLPAIAMPSDEELGLAPLNASKRAVEVMVLPEGVANATAANASLGDTYDLARTVNMALDRNPRLEASRASLRAARQGRNSKVGPFLPTLSGGYQYSYTDRPRLSGTPPSQSPNQYMLFFNVRQNLFTGWRVLNDMRKAMLQVEQAETNLYNDELSLLITVQENYLNLLGFQENVRSAQDSVTRLKSQLQVTQAFYDVGLRPRLDVLQAEVDLGNAEDTLLQAQNRVDTTRARLATLMDMELKDPIVYKGELRYVPYEVPLEDCLGEAYRNRPDLQIFQRAIKIARRDADIAGSVILPQVAAEIDWFQTGDRPDLKGDSVVGPLNKHDTYRFTIGVQWEIFDFGQNFFTWRQAKELVTQFEADYANQFLEATFDVKSRHLQISETAKRIKVAFQSLAQAKEGYRMAVARYQAQVGTNTEVLDAQARLTSAEAQMTQALVDNQIALANLFVAMGRKNVTLDIAPVSAPANAKPVAKPVVKKTTEPAKDAKKSKDSVKGAPVANATAVQ